MCPSVPTYALARLIYMTGGHDTARTDNNIIAGHSGAMSNVVGGPQWRSRTNHRSLPSDSRRKSTHWVHVHGQRFRSPALEGDRTTYPPANVMEPVYRPCAFVGAITDAAAAPGVDSSHDYSPPLAQMGMDGEG